jgi:plastocyanin
MPFSHSSVAGFVLMLQRLVRSLCAVLLCSAVVGGRAACGEDPGGAIAGAVFYEPDAERPWRYARYYIHDRDTGELAEAVVCLSAKSLSGLQPRSEPAEVVMDQKDYRFVPETIAVRARDRVRFTNGDPAAHNVFTGDGSDPFNVTTAVDGSHLQTFRRAGGIRRPIRIGCAFHSTMQAWIFVFDHPFYAVTAEDGRFRFEGVPPGEYTLEVVHPAGRLAWSTSVTITDAGDLLQDVRLSADNLDEDKP